MAKYEPFGVDLEIARFYAPLILGSLKYGENRICIWFPGCGKTNSINLLLSNKTLLKSNLGELYKRTIIIPFSGYDSENSQSDEVLKEIYLKLNPKDTLHSSEGLANSIIDECRKIVDQGKEVVFVGNEIENLSQVEYNKLLNNLLRIVLTNRARIHTIINIKNKDMYVRTVSTNNSLLTLSNKIQYIPVLSGHLLRDLINKFIQTFEKKISEKEIVRIEKYSGGISILTKELIRNYPDEGQINLKFHECLTHISKASLDNISEKKKYQVHDLSIINDKKYLASENPKEHFTLIANDNELKIFNFLNKNKNKLISKENLADIVWGNNEDADYSDWAIDQIISRFRKKMIKAEIDPQVLETVKGKGYKWKF